MPKFKENQMPRWLKSKPKTLTFKKEQIDHEKGIIKDVVMCEVGEAKGHEVHLEQEFINALIAYDNKNYKKTGVKARFGHPAMSDTTMGKQMGYFHNYRVRDNQAIADLHLLESSNKSPSNPGLKEWMLSMADEAPDFVMCSIVFQPSGYYQRDDDNKKRYCYYYKETKDNDGDTYYRWVGPDEELGNVFVELGEHYYTDMVEAGAATNSLFSSQFNQEKFAIRAIEWVRENADIHQFLQENPAKLADFAKQLGVELPSSKVTLSDKWKALRDLFIKDGGEDVEKALSEVTKLQEQIAEMETVNQTQLATHNKAILELNQSHQSAITEKDNTIADLQKEIKQLKAFVPEGHTEFDTPPSKTPSKPKIVSPQTQRAIDSFARKRNRNK